MFFDYELKNFNYRLFIYMIVLNIIGVMVIRSASNQDADIVNKQIMGIIVGCAIVVGLSMVDYHYILSMGTLIYGGCVLLLIAVLQWGRVVNNARRWIVLPGIGQIQPSEFVKIGIVLFFAWYFNKYRARINQFRTLVIGGGLFLILFILIYKEPDLSTGLVAGVIFLCMLYSSGISYRWIFGGLAVMTPIAGLMIYLLQYNMVPLIEDYQARRILAWVYPKKFAEANIQQANSIMAIGSGMLNGKGLNNNTLASVKNGNFLAEEQTDFIFAVVGEELGFIGGVIVIVLIALVTIEFLWMASKAKDLSGKLVCVGMAALVAFQSFSNIAVATGVFPNTGLPLPFLSSGVSSLLSLYIGIGIALNVGLQRKVTN